MIFEAVPYFVFRFLSGEWSLEEDKILYELRVRVGPKWCEISKQLPGRTENAVKNRNITAFYIFASPLLIFKL